MTDVTSSKSARHAHHPLATGTVDEFPPRAPVKGVLEDTTMRTRGPNGGVIELGTRLGTGLGPRLPRLPRGRDVLTLPEGDAITVRRADRSDIDAASAMHARCSDHTLGLRYHGPVGDADRYLDHLLSPRHGRTLAVRTASGRLVALGHLLWDGDETEVALIVEDAWQRRGIGSELLGRLVTLAVESGCTNMYAVTEASNTGMVAVMRGLGLPLDHRIEGRTLVVTARLRGTDETPYGTPEIAPHDRAGR